MKIKIAYIGGGSKAWLNQPSCGGLRVEDARALFEKMCDNVRDADFPF